MVKKPTKPFAYGQTLKARVHCLHMERRTVYATLWEDDAAGAGHDKANEKNKMKTLPGTVKEGIADIDFVLEPDFAKIANAIKAKGDADEGKTHEYYVTAEILNKKTASANTNVANPGDKAATTKPTVPASTLLKKKHLLRKKAHPKNKRKKNLLVDGIIDWLEGIFKVKPIVAPNPKAPTGNNPLKVGEPDKNPKEDKKDDKKSTCPNCDKPITAEELKKIFTDADSATLKKAADAYTKYMKDLGMNTCWNKAHFFAQASIEVGKSFTLKNGESLNYSTKRLIDGDYSTDFVKGNLATKTGGHFTKGKFHKRPYSYFDTHNDEAEKYGRKDLNKNNDGLIQKANQEMIANLAYGPNSKPGKEIGNINSTDGWKFRGRGLVQLTGRGNYDKVNSYTIKHASVNILENPEKVNEVNLAVLTSMGYWKNHGGDKKANGQIDENVLSKIIGNDVDYAGKKKSFDDVTSKIFKIKECQFKKADTQKENKPAGNVTIRLVRKWETEISTIGEFTIDGSDIKGYILEEKGPDTTVSGIQQRVPVGTYNLKWHNGSKQKGVLKLYNAVVPESRAILIHSGNDASDTEGCLLAGSTKSKDFVGASKPKLKEINDYVTLKGIEGAKIIITANYE